MTWAQCPGDGAKDTIAGGEWGTEATSHLPCFYVFFYKALKGLMAPKALIRPLRAL